jgi:hypothetical protein
MLLKSQAVLTFNVYGDGNAARTFRWRIPMGGKQDELFSGAGLEKRYFG